MDDVWKDISLSSLNHPSPTTASATSDCGSTHPSNIVSLSTDFFGSQSSPPPPATALNLNSPSNLLPPSAATRNRVAENEENAGNRRLKRMMKNRASAARSRARKQAYTTELEQKLESLLEENAMLRRQMQEEFRVEGCAQLPKTQTLYRTLTAPF